MKDIDLRFVKPYIDDSVYLFPSTKASFLGFRVIDEIIALHQLGHNKISGKQLGDYHPKLRYVRNREEMLEEMCGDELILPKENNKHIPVFKRVEFANRHVVFELTDEALPYLNL